MVGAAWCETYKEFEDWLEEIGATVDKLPDWPGRAPVRVLATPGSRLYLERVSRREYRDFQRMTAAGKVKFKAVPMARIEELHAVDVTAVDFAKFRAWKTNDERCN